MYRLVKISLFPVCGFVIMISRYVITQLFILVRQLILQN